mmetsp:Transcript_46306/g.140432  ORF Transcript_46306/g.140432 Transcript_46306/m.140432 type:complete len:238 (-) Transcript_46306:753-1466(-)
MRDSQGVLAACHRSAQQGFGLRVVARANQVGGPTVQRLQRVRVRGAERGAAAVRGGAQEGLGLLLLIAHCAEQRCQIGRDDQGAGVVRAQGGPAPLQRLPEQRHRLVVLAQRLEHHGPTVLEAHGPQMRRTERDRAALQRGPEDLLGLGEAPRPLQEQRQHVHRLERQRVGAPVPLLAGRDRVPQQALRLWHRRGRDARQRYQVVQRSEHRRVGESPDLLHSLDSAPSSPYSIGCPC